jgi:hypothetical protein
VQFVCFTAMVSPKQLSFCLRNSFAPARLHNFLVEFSLCASETLEICPRLHSFAIFKRFTLQFSVVAERALIVPPLRLNFLTRQPPSKLSRSIFLITYASNLSLVQFLRSRAIDSFQAQGSGPSSTSGPEHPFTPFGSLYSGAS